MEGMVIVSAPGIGKCPVCAVRHAASEPHEIRSLYYMMRFHYVHGREPDIDDARAHLGENTEEVVRNEA